MLSTLMGTHLAIVLLTYCLVIKPSMNTNAFGIHWQYSMATEHPSVQLLFLCN